MILEKFLKIFLIFSIICLTSYLIYLKFYKNTKNLSNENLNNDIKYSSNIIKNVEYVTKDKDGNEYFIKALQGEIDLKDPNNIYLTDVYALIKINDSEKITIVSEFGKYNSQNYDTIFSKNVIINYLLNNITSEYVDFSLKRNSMIITKNVIYTNLDNTLKADVVEVNLKTKDTKIFMHDKKKKINIKSSN